METVKEYEEVFIYHYWNYTNNYSSSLFNKVFEINLTKLLKNEHLIIEVVEEIKKDYKISYRAIIEELGISESTWKRIKKNKTNN